MKFADISPSVVAALNAWCAYVVQVFNGSIVAQEQAGDEFLALMDDLDDDEIDQYNSIVVFLSVLGEFVRNLVGKSK